MKLFVIADYGCLFCKMGGSLELNELFEHVPEELRKVFVETGTFKGATTVLAAPYFKQVVTIELSQSLYDENQRLFKYLPNVIAKLGKSVDVLNDPFIRDVYKDGAVFFLDAHISGWDSTYDEQLHVPLLEEISIINKEQLGESLFIIDDVRLWEDADWPFTTEMILDRFKNDQIVKYYVQNDRLWIHCKNTRKI